MRAGRQGFALILVLLSAAAAFALAIHGATVMRASTLEARVLHDRLAAERDARSSVVMVLSGLFTAGTASDDAALMGDSKSSSSGADGAAGGDQPKDKPKIELPPIIREVIGKQADEIDKKNKEQAEQNQSTQRVAEGNGMAGQAGSGGAFAVLKKVGLPGDEIEVKLTPKDPRSFRVRMRDASGQLSVNVSSEDQLERYFVAKNLEPQLARRLAEEIVDWRDEDDRPHQSGAEAEQYRPRGITPRNAAIRSLEELRFLPSMTRELYDTVRTDLTVGSDKKVHIGSCSREVLLSLPGVSPEFAEKVVAARKEGVLTTEWLDRNLPIAARDARQQMRLEPSNIVWFEVMMTGETAARFEGLAIISEKGVESVGIRSL